MSASTDNRAEYYATNAGRSEDLSFGARCCECIRNSIKRLLVVDINQQARNETSKDLRDDVLRNLTPWETFKQSEADSEAGIEVRSRNGAANHDSQSDSGRHNRKRGLSSIRRASSHCENMLTRVRSTDQC